MSFHRRIVLGFLGTLTAAVLVAVASWHTMHTLEVSQKLLLRNDIEQMERVHDFHSGVQSLVGATRGYLLTGNPEFIKELESLRASLHRDLSDLSEDQSSPNKNAVLARIRAAEQERWLIAQEAIEMRQRGLSHHKIAVFFEKALVPKRLTMSSAISELLDLQRQRLVDTKDATSRAFARGRLLVGAVASVALLLAAALAVTLSRTLIRLYQNAQEATRLRDNMVAVVSHDLKNPLEAIRLSSAALQKTLTAALGNTSTARLSKQIYDTAGRMSQMISDILNLSKFKEGRLEMNFQPVKLRELISNCEYTMRPMIEQKEIRLQVDCEEQLRLVCDQGRIGQVISNLLGNAIKFSPKLSTVTLQVTDRDTELLFSIADRGPGISENDRTQVFERFWNGKSSLAHGTGLGLSIAKAFVDSHGGTIWVESTVGAGSTFYFTLPKNPAAFAGKEVA